MGCTGWSADDCWPLIARLETSDGPGDHHGRAGPVMLRQIPPHDPCGVAVLAAAAAVGLPTLRFNEGATVTEGAGFFQINADEHNTRVSSSRGYLHPIIGRRHNLVVRTDSWVRLVLFDADKRATGVEYLEAGRYASRPMVTCSTQWWEIGLFTRTEPGLDRPDLMTHYGCVPFDMNTVRWGYPTTSNGFCLTPNVTRGRSRGTVRLRSRDFRDRAKVDPRYFTDPESHDLAVMLVGIRLARRIAAQPALRGWVKRELAPGPDAVTDDELIDYIGKTHNTVYHPAGTARMGAADDPAAVLDARLRVRGVTGLRVADASVMPFLPAVNPNITIMMIGEKASDLLAQDASQR
jgi:choline oxidase